MPSRDLIYIHKVEGKTALELADMGGKSWGNPASTLCQTQIRKAQDTPTVGVVSKGRPDTKAEEREEPSIFACSCRMPDVL